MLLAASQFVSPVLAQPMLCVIKEIACALPQNQSGLFSKQARGARGDQAPGFAYRITVSNCGTEDLADVSVLDTVLGNVTAQFAPAGQLAAGASATHTFRLAAAQDTTNTVTALGRGVSSGTPVSANDSVVALVDTASLLCSAFVTSPADLDGDGRNGFVFLPGGGAPHQITYGATLSNECRLPLAGITLTSPELAALGCASFPAPFHLPVGGSTNIILCSIPFTCPMPGTFASIVATGAVDPAWGCAFDTNGQPITVRSEGTALVGCDEVDRFEDCNDTLCLTKEVACLLPGGMCGPFSASAIGIRHIACPAFCYRIKISNCGTGTLTSITVRDDQLDLSNCDFPSNLAVGQSATCEIPVEHCSSVIGTLTVVAVQKTTGLRVTNSAATTVMVKPANLTCDLTLTSPLDTDSSNCVAGPCDNHLLLPGGFSGPIGFSITVKNTGEATLDTISFAGLPPGCAPANVPATLAPGASFRSDCTPTVTCPAGPYDVRVTANISGQNNGMACVSDRSGNPISIGHSCQALMECNWCPVAVVRISANCELLPGQAATIVISGDNATGCVTLDGSQSSDQDGDPLTHSWLADLDRDGQKETIATGVSATRCLPLGSHDITLVVSDGRCTTNAVTTVVVLTACEAIEVLIAAVNAADLPRSSKRPLIASLNSACASFDRGHCVSGVNQLGAFQNKVRAQVGQVDPALAAELAAFVKNLIGCIDCK